VIFGAISIFAFLSWYFIPEDKWLRSDQVRKALETVGEDE
jgi:translation initiation factor 5B